MVKRLEKEYNPALQFDAFTAGIEDGGLRSSSSIAILACYIIARSKEKLTAKNVVDALVEGKIANYFEISSAISKMIKTNNLVENEDGHLSITEKCAFNVEMLENDLPITIREKAVELAAKTARLELYKKENKATVEKNGNRYKVTLHVSDKDCDFMVLSLYFPSEAQAQVVKEKFQTHPGEVYENLINSIFANE